MPLVALLKEIARFLKAVDRKLPREFRGHIKAIICLIFALAMIQEVRGRGCKALRCQAG